MSEESGGFWHALEAVSGGRAVLAEWRAHMGADYTYAATLLRPTGERAASYPCQNLAGCGCGHEVVIHAEDDIVALCRCGPGCPTFTVDITDLAVYELNRAALDHGIASAFGVYDDRAGNTKHSGTTCLGGYSFTVRKWFPVYLAISQGRVEFERIAHALLSEAETPFVLVAPTHEYCCAPLQQLLLARKCAFFALGENMALLDNGRLTPLRDLDVVLTGFREANAPPAIAAAAATAPAASGAIARTAPVREEWPDPATTCYATHELRKDGVLVFRVRAEGPEAREVRFGLAAGGKPTKQLQLMRVLCNSWPHPTTLKDGVAAAYGEELQGQAPGNSGQWSVCLGRFRPLVGAIRAKFEKHGINPEILPAINPYKRQYDGLLLQLADLSRKTRDELTQP